MSKQDYLDHVLGSLPYWFVQNDRVMENLKAFAEMYCRVEEQTDFWHQMSYILVADSGEPDWLNQHAIDRGTSRQDGESDEALRIRLRSFADAVSVQALLDRVQALMDEAGLAGTPELLELKTDGSYLGEVTPIAWVAGEFVSSDGTNMVFEPNANFEVPFANGVTAGHELFIFGAADAGNNGTFPITGIEGNGVKFDNASGVAGVDATVNWRIDPVDSSGNALSFFQCTYLDRGHRVGSLLAMLVIMLPYGCTEPLRATVEESIRQVKGAGVLLVVECRENP